MFCETYRIRKGDNNYADCNFQIEINFARFEVRRRRLQKKLCTWGKCASTSKFWGTFPILEDDVDVVSDFVDVEILRWFFTILKKTTSSPFWGRSGVLAASLVSRAPSLKAECIGRLQNVHLRPKIPRSLQMNVAFDQKKIFRRD